MFLYGVYHDGVTDETEEFASKPDTVPFYFPKDLEYTVSIDQSYSCSGIHISSTDDMYHLMFDMPRTTEGEHLYLDLLLNIMKHCVKDLNVKTFRYEAVPVAKYQRTGRKLKALERFVSDFTEIIPEFRNAEKVGILPQQWKSAVIDKSKGKGRFRSKLACAEDVCDVYPFLRKYKERCISSDYDSFEAVGITIGHKRLTVDGDNNPKLYSTERKRSSLHALMRPIHPNEFTDLNQVFKGIEFLLSGDYKVDIAYADEERVLMDNLQMANRGDKVNVVIFKNKIHLLNLCWECKIVYNPDYLFMAVVIPDKLYTKTLTKQISNDYHCLNIRGLV